MRGQTHVLCKKKQVVVKAVMLVGISLNLITNACLSTTLGVMEIRIVMSH